jgi:hypothetical protein
VMSWLDGRARMRALSFWTKEGATRIDAQRSVHITYCHKLESPTRYCSAIAPRFFVDIWLRHF